VLDADLAGAFDPIGHDHLMSMLGAFPARGKIRQWLKAGVVENGRLARTEQGTPQGGVISPVLLNIAVHGMETVVGVRYLASGSVRIDSPVAIRYADDFARHEAPCDRMEVKGLHRRLVAAGW
jgi:RNA-directed DNA polymerase